MLRLYETKNPKGILRSRSAFFTNKTATKAKYINCTHKPQNSLPSAVGAALSRAAERAAQASDATGAMERDSERLAGAVGLEVGDVGASATPLAPLGKRRRDEGSLSEVCAHRERRPPELSNLRFVNNV